MTVNREEMLSIYNQFQLSSGNVETLKKLKGKNLRAIVITEDWCGDAIVNNPIFMKIAETAGVEVRFLLRDQNLELMDQYLPTGRPDRFQYTYLLMKKERNMPYGDQGHRKFRNMLNMSVPNYQTKKHRNSLKNKRKCIKP